MLSGNQKQWWRLVGKFVDGDDDVTWCESEIFSFTPNASFNGTGCWHGNLHKSYPIVWVSRVTGPRTQAVKELRWALAFRCATRISWASAASNSASTCQMMKGWKPNICPLATRFHTRVQPLELLFNLGCFFTFIFCFKSFQEFRTGQNSGPKSAFNIFEASKLSIFHHFSIVLFRFINMPKTPTKRCDQVPRLLPLVPKVSAELHGLLRQRRRLLRLLQLKQLLGPQA